MPESTPSGAAVLPLMTQGDALANAGRAEEAAASYARAVTVAVQAGDNEAVAMLAGNLGNLALNGGQPEQALAHYEQAVAAYRTIDDLPWAAAMLTSWGNALQDLGQLDAAIARHREAEALAASVEAHDWQGRAANNLGNVLAQQEEFAKAAEAHERALQIGEHGSDAQLVGLASRALRADLRGSAEQLEALADLLEPVQDAPGNVTSRLDALAAWRKTDDTDAQARCLARLVALLTECDQLDSAEGTSHEHLALAIRSGSAGQRTFALGQLGEIALKRGQFARALRLLHYQRDLAREPGGATDLEILALDRLASAYLGLGRINLAERCLMMLQALPDGLNMTPALRAQRLNNCALIAERRGDMAQAQVCYDSGLAGLAPDDSSSQALGLRLNLADLLRQRGDREASITQIAFVLDHSTEHPLSRAAAWIALGRQAQAEGDSATALNGFVQAASLAERLGDGPRLAQALALEGAVSLSLGDLEAGEHAAQRAVAAAEAQGVQLDDLSSVRLFASQEAPFRLLQRVLLARQRSDAALAAGERSRARALTQVLVQRQAGGRRVRDSKAALANAAFDAMMNCSGDLQGASSVTASWVRQALAKLALPNVEPEPRPLPSIDAMRAIAGQHGASLIEYSMLDDDTLCIWVVQADAVHHRPAPPRPDGALALAQQVQALLTRLADASAPVSEVEAALRSLHRWLIEPIADLLPPDALLCIVPDGALYRVPFAALLDAQNEPLVARHPLCHAPSIEVLALSREAARLLAEKGPAGPPLIVGQPSPVRLPAGFDASQTLPELVYAAQEARDIAEQLDAGKPLLGAQATHAAVLAKLPAAGLVHLAAHALLNEELPSASAVLLAAPEGADGDGALSVEQLQQQSLRASLVVLSACSTALGPVTGDGVAGFARALLVAGAPSAVVALWPLADSTTWDLMVAFYRRLAHEDDVATALQQAMLEQRQSTPDPRHWAAMVLYGQAGTRIARVAP